MTPLFFKDDWERDEDGRFYGDGGGASGGGREGPTSPVGDPDAFAEALTEQTVGQFKPGSPERQAVVDYKNTSQRVNEALRDGLDDPDVEAIDTVMSQDTARLQEDALLFRGADSPELRDAALNDIDSVVGAEVRDSAFLSTSASDVIAKDAAEGMDGVVLEIHCEAGTRAIGGEVINYLKEAEVILDRDVPMEVIASRMDESRGVPVLEVLPTDLGANL